MHTNLSHVKVIVCTVAGQNKRQATGKCPGAPDGQSTPAHVCPYTWVCFFPPDINKFIERIVFYYYRNYLEIIWSFDYTLYMMHCTELIWIQIMEWIAHMWDRACESVHTWDSISCLVFLSLMLSSQISPQMHFT